MVEGHSVHRVAASHRRRLVGKKFACTSPNGRFTEGAAAINKKTFRAIEAVGKNLFAWFGNGDDDDVCVRVHFGMAGNWAVFEGDEPTTTATTLPTIDWSDNAAGAAACRHVQRRPQRQARTATPACHQAARPHAPAPLGPDRATASRTTTRAHAVHETTG